MNFGLPCVSSRVWLKAQSSFPGTCPDALSLLALLIPTFLLILTPGSSPIAPQDLCLCLTAAVVCSQKRCCHQETLESSFAPQLLLKADVVMNKQANQKHREMWLLFVMLKMKHFISWMKQTMLFEKESG